jgi:ElaB/YqjD/DUF883 family membrane-anchored ribosome-binding protein
MTECTCASAQSSASTPPFKHVSAASLIFRARDAASNLDEVQQAYAGLELLIAPVGSEDAEEIHASRSQLSALLRLVNEEFERRIEAVKSAIDSAHGAVCQARCQGRAPEEAKD